MLPCFVAAERWCLFGASLIAIGRGGAVDYIHAAAVVAVISLVQPVQGFLAGGAGSGP